ncbi:MAG TPA: YheU family protein [Spongiibacteraceae bacterium]|jgi:hypothetical protein
MNDILIVPPEQLSDEALQGVIEEFIMREGTDYGAVEWSLADKARQLRAQLRSGAAQIVFDPITESCTIMTRETIQKREISDDET